MFKIVFFVPLEHAERVKNAMFNAGGGKIGQYDCCSFETLGTGQFRPLKGANPFVGDVGVLEKVSELKVEMVCENHCIKAVIAAMKENHPYEMLAYDIIKLEDY